MYQQARIWPTLTGAAILTPEAIGFGFFTSDDFVKLQADLDAGIPLHQLVGFSGSIFPLEKLQRVVVQEKDHRVVIECRDWLGKMADDFNFLTHAACEEFCQALVQQLGPPWRRGKVQQSLVITFLWPLFFMLMSLPCVCVGIVLPFLPPSPAAPQKTPEAQQLDWAVLGLGIVVFLLGLVWFFYRRKNPKVMDVIERF
jgi:hypothetical protein